ncbi:uncharacterized protein SCHCODRAFT_02682117 [Schizophyllum commune H4-8]|nr:uncharacterized protein SCHCODRAFT_02682117 [Schizophyllum commune H4-8]KAI5899056.1 hypothetical protein SCHCODRAFT_02682117 [Schizophyllum commune H4-8]
MRLPSFTKHSSKGTSSKDSVATGDTLPGTGTDDHATATKPTTKLANESSSPFTITCIRCGTVLSVYITTKRIEEIQQAGNSELNKHQRRCEGPRRSPSQTGRSAAAPTSSKDAPTASLWNKPRASSENATATFDANGAFLKRVTAAGDSRSSSSMPPTAVPSNMARASKRDKTTTDHAGARAAKRPTTADRSRPSFVAPSTSSGPSRSTGPSHSARSFGTARPAKPARAPSYTDFYQREIEATKRAREEEEARAAAALAVHRGRKRGPEVPIEKDAGAMDEVMASIYNGKAKAEDEAERNVKKQRTA